MSIFFCISKVYPHVAGNSFPILSRKFGNSSAENIIPDNIIDGRNTIWLYIVSFAWFLTAKPNIHEIASDTIINKTSVIKYNGKSKGKFASNIMGATIKMIVLIIIKWINDDVTKQTILKYMGIPFEIYIFFIFVLYVSTIDGGTPINDPIETPITVIDCISVFLASGIKEVKILPIIIKNRSGTI